jgi:hypothetical protein
MDYDLLPAIGPMSPAWRDFFVMLGVMVFIIAGALIWAIFLRRKRRRRAHHFHHRRHRTSYREQLRKGATGIKQYVQERRRRHRVRYPVNPTLAQTGGLPPVRPEESSDATPSQTQ